MTIDEIKQFCRIDDDYDDSLIEMLKQSAETYLEGAGVPISYDDMTYKLTVMCLVRYYYDERLSGGAPETLNDAITQLQLKYKE